MSKKNNNKGFTLAELLIVVAIIAVLVAIAIPVFNSQLEKSREATDGANIRSMYAQVMTQILTDEKTSISTTDNKYHVSLKQLTANWQNKDMWSGLKELEQDKNDTDGTMGISVDNTVSNNASQGAVVKFEYTPPTSGNAAGLKIVCSAP